MITGLVWSDRAHAHRAELTVDAVEASLIAVALQLLRDTPEGAGLVRKMSDPASFRLVLDEISSQIELAVTRLRDMQLATEKRQDGGGGA